MIGDIIILSMAFTHRQVAAGVTVEMLGESLLVCLKGHERPAPTFLSLLIKWPVHEIVRLSEEAVHCAGALTSVFNLGNT